VLTNPNLLAQLPRQANVTLSIFTKEGTKESFYNRLVEATILSLGGNTFLEVRRFKQQTDPEPVCITTYVNPLKWELVAGPDGLVPNEQ